MNLYNTKTFTYGEKEEVRTVLGEQLVVHYCGYCGQKAHAVTSGETYNHRYEEEVYYACSCVEANAETELYEERDKLKHSLYEVERKLEQLQEKKDSLEVQQIKYEKELRRLQVMYGIEEGKESHVEGI